MKKQLFTAMAVSLTLSTFTSLSASTVFLSCPDELSFTLTGTANASDEYNINIDSTLSGMPMNGFALGKMKSPVSESCKLASSVNEAAKCTLTPTSATVGPESDNPFLSCMYSVSADSSINPAPIALVTTTDSLNGEGYSNCQVSQSKVGFDCEK